MAPCSGVVDVVDFVDDVNFVDDGDDSGEFVTLLVIDSYSD